MKITRFRSDWNGQRSDKAYHKKPTIEQIKQAQKKPVYFDNTVILANDRVAEVRCKTGGSYYKNIYRDFYSINK